MSREAVTIEQLREVRGAFDALSPGDRATLKRCRDADEMMLEGAFWRVAAPCPDSTRPRLANVVVCFPAADQVRRHADFSVGAFLRRGLQGKRRTLGVAQTLRFRQLVQARDLDDLCHRLRRLLTHLDRPVDWGVLGLNVFFWSDSVRRRWAQDFYAPTEEEANV